MADSFGALLRECRANAGVSMGELARRVNYSRSYLSKIENDLKPPNPTLARLCDGELDAGGTLIEWARSARERPAGQVVLPVGAVRDTAPTAGLRPAPDEPVVALLRASFEHLCGLGMQTSPTVVLDPLVAHGRVVYRLAQENAEPVRSRLLLLAARIAEYTGWLKQEAGDEQGALWWTRYAARLSEAGGDTEIASYALVREAGLALYRQDPLGTISLARQAQETGGAGARILALAARREAQGHALGGNRGGFERAMNSATELLDASTMDIERYPVLGSTAPDPLELARGWSLADLGKTAAAAAVLDEALIRLPAANRRTRARFGARRSLAYALSGEIEQSCSTLAETLDDAAHVDSATVRLDLRELSRTLSRWRNHRAVREIHPALSRVLRRY